MTQNLTEILISHTREILPYESDAVALLHKHQQNPEDLPDTSAIPHEVLIACQDDLHETLETGTTLLQHAKRLAPHPVDYPIAGFGL